MCLCFLATWKVTCGMVSANGETRMKKRLGPALALMVLCAFSASALDTAQFSKTCTITLAGYTGSTTLAGFPVLVRLSSAIEGFDYADVMQGGADICFTDSSGNQLAHEIDTWNDAGESLVWVKVPSLSGTTTQIRLYYGSGTATANTPANVWTKYATVVHGGASPFDSSPNARAVTVGPNTIAIADGRLGAANFITNRVTDTAGIFVANPQTVMTDSTRFTISAWLTEEKSGQTHILFGSMNAWNTVGFLILNEGGRELSFTSRGASGDGSGHKRAGWTWTPGEWRHVAVTYDSTTGTSYYNGAQHFTATIPAVGNPNNQFGFGNYGKDTHGDHLFGKLDECRVFNGAATADWVKAEYDSVDNPSFAVFGAVRSTADVQPTVVKIGAISQTSESVHVAGLLEAMGDGVTSVTVSLCWGLTSALEGAPVVVGTYTGLSQLGGDLAGLSAGERYYAAFKVVNSLGATAWSETTVFYFGAEQLWRPQSESDTWASAAWQLANGAFAGGEIMTFIPGASARFDGAETAHPAVVAVPAEVAAAKVTVAGSRDYTLTGEAIDAPLVAKMGSGTLTLAGKGFKDPDEIVISGGTVRLDPLCDRYVLGTRATPVRISGGSLDICSTNYNDHNVSSHVKRFIVKGTGDGEGVGVIYNSGEANTAAALHTLELEGDTLIGAPFSRRMDLRPLTGSPNGGRPRITGPADATLTVVGKPTTTEAPTGNDTLCLIDTDVDVGCVRVTGGTMLSFEAASMMAAGSRLALADGEFRLWSLANPFTAPIAAERGANLFGTGSGTAVVEGPIAVDPSATLSLGLGGRTIYRGGISGGGAVDVTLGYHMIASDFERDSVNVNGTDANAPNAALFIGDAATSSGVEFKTPSAVTLGTAGMFGLAPVTNTTYRNLQVSGDGAFNPCFVETASSVTARIENTEMTLDSIRMGTGDKKSAGYAVLGNGVDITVKKIYLGDCGGTPGPATLTLEEGSRVTVNSEVIIGRWGGWSLGTLHKIVVDGGELETVGDVIRVGYDTCYGELWLNDGVLSPRGLDIRYRWDNGNGMTVTNTVSRELFVMNGGTLNLGQLGFNTQRAIPICPAAWLGGGTVRNRHPSNDEGAGWSMRHKYLHMAFETWGRFEGPQSVEPNMLVIDLDGKKSDFRTAIQGNGNVTLKGGGEFTADVDVKGGVNGSWKIENEGVNVLKNVAGFAGGLTLAPNVTVTLDIPDEEHIAGVNIFSATASRTTSPTQDEFASAECGAPCWFADITPLTTLTPTPLYTSFRFEGDFYVENAGSYTFCCTYDDELAFWVDDSEVCRNAAWNGYGRGALNLAQGWHKFKLVAKDLGGGAGPNPAEWSAKKMAIGWHFGETTSESAADYEPFDSKSFRMRPGTSVRLVRNLIGQGAYTDAWTDPLYTESRVLNTLQVIHDVNWALGKKAVCELSGWFLVEKDKGGEWFFNGVYDDRISLKIDGETVLETTAYATAATGSIILEPGWHAFQVRTFDYGGGISSTRGDALNYSVGGGEATPFDERTLRISATPYGRIAGVLALGEGAFLTNAASTPCAVEATLSGTGTLDGQFVLRGATWELEGVARASDLKGVTFSNSPANALAGLGKVKVAFDAKPTRSRYMVGPALGLTGAEEIGVEATYIDAGVVKPYPDVKLRVENGVLYLANTKPAGLTLFMR